MKNPLKQMKQVQKGMVLMMYEIYLAGYTDGYNDNSCTPLISIKEFSQQVKEIHKRGQKIVKEELLHGARNNTINASEKSH